MKEELWKRKKFFESCARSVLLISMVLTAQVSSMGVSCLMPFGYRAKTSLTGRRRFTNR